MLKFALHVEGTDRQGASEIIDCQGIWEVLDLLPVVAERTGCSAISVFVDDEKLFAYDCETTKLSHYARYSAYRDAVLLS